MELNEMEKRLLYQTEGCERYAVISELSLDIKSRTATKYIIYTPLFFHVKKTGEIAIFNC